MRKQTKGICPSCGKKGETGARCQESVCELRGYHLIPEAYGASEPARTYDPLIGLMMGDYLVVQIIGAGSFGRVYMAMQQPLGMKAAVKLLDFQRLPESLTEMLEKKFQAEAEALSMIQHPNIVRLLHYGRKEGRPYLVTELVEEGVTLEEEIDYRAETNRLFSGEELERLFQQLLDGLTAAHKIGIIHRDIKPENLMLQNVEGYPDMLRILDFGLAKFLDTGDSTATTSGTPDYMAPEQLTRKRLGPWTDLYAIGTIAFELFTGRKPFAAENIKETFFLKVSKSYEPTKRLTGLDMPEEVIDFLKRALSCDVEKRYQSVDAFRAGLKNALPAWADHVDKAQLPISFRELLHEATYMQVLPPEEDTELRAPADSAEEAFKLWLQQENRRLEDQAEKLEKDRN
jgi:serine/threonine-protein kinase